MLKLANLRVGIALIWNFDLAKHVQTLQIFKIRSVYEFAKFYKQAQSTPPSRLNITYKYGLHSILSIILFWRASCHEFWYNQ